MRFTSRQLRTAAMAATLVWLMLSSSAQAELRPGWNGKRHVSYQQQKDLFYNYYAQPGPFNGAAAEMYVCPRPVPVDGQWRKRCKSQPRNTLRASSGKRV